jgi:hypothetical protein
MANSIALIQKYSPELLDEAFAKGACTTILERYSNLLKFINANTVLIPDIVLSGLGDYSRANGYPSGDASIAWTPYTQRKDRGKTFSVDRMDNEETAGVAYGVLQKEFMRTKVIPEVDAYRLSTLFASAAASNVVKETIAANSIVGKFNTAEKAFEDNEISLEDSVFFISTNVNTLIKNTTELEKKIGQIDYKTDSGITFTLRAYDNIPIIVVPPTRFKTSFVFGADGFTPTAAAYTLTEDEALDAKKTYYTKSGETYSAVAEPAVENIGTYYELTTEPAKDINFMLVNLASALPIKKHEKIRVFDPDNNQTKDAWKIDYRLYHDIFTPKNKVNGIYVSHVA